MELGSTFTWGKPEDDLINKHWQNWFLAMPGFARYMSMYQDPRSTEARGNAMEIAAGIAYSAAHSGDNFPKWHQLAFPSVHSLEEWTVV